MATVIVDRVTFGQSAIRYILAAGSDPASDGLAAGLGSKAELEDGSAEWRKTGAFDTDWVRVDVLEHEASASAHTPAEVGSDPSGTGATAAANAVAGQNPQNDALSVDLVHDAGAAGNPQVFISPVWSMGGGFAQLWANSTNHDPVAVGVATDRFFMNADADPVTNQGAGKLYYDEDAAEGARFLQSDFALSNLLIPTRDGRVMQVSYNASASSLGVEVYHATGEAERYKWRFVSPTATNGTEKTSVVKALVQDLT